MKNYIREPIPVEADEYDGLLAERARYREALECIRDNELMPRLSRNIARGALASDKKEGPG